MTDLDAVDEHVRPHLDSSALLVIDVQNDFLDGGPLPVPGTTAVLPRLVELVGAFRRAHRPIVHVVRIYDGDDVDPVRRTAVTRDDARIVRPGTEGSRIPPQLLPPGAPELDPDILLRGELQPFGDAEAALWKPRWSAFHRTGLEAHLAGAGVDTIVVAGCNLPNCPRATLFDASSRDLRTVLVTDATSQVSDERLADARSIGVVPMTAAEVGGALRSAF
ncbi:isochorismatase family protein [Rhodococcus hoagii]|uniref:cysteine hydrolase family protein n=1 Tax=Rhodococcus hoagii TaxID=43767 RepID=UPI000A0F85D0|nr:isochorismatase family cysteine hydrolase [Prescottella equi]MBM4536992.1 isochorismatase family protein [Prescottella equi]NKR83235.1 isochorismatase family protein [Prescottella equi]NKS81198.1 isochorismatase family protein [Prescottella equi]NKS98959.1 isochorismatase family protein [Prescottella equi]NKV12432.1 isochorismatase family protein [Prescottella equi]